MKSGYIFTLLVLAFLITACGGGGGGGSSPPPASQPAPAPEPTSFDYNFEGAAIKGAISGARITISDAEGNTLGDASISEGNGSYQVSFSTTDELQPPLLISVDGTNATTVCDLSPVCKIGLNDSGDPVTANFGESYPLPDGFVLRAAIESLDTSANGTTSGTAYVSPLSEFVVAAALSMGDGQLTASNLDVANERIAEGLRDIYPLLEIPAGLVIASIPLIDITDLEDADLSDTSELGLAITSVSAGILDFVDPENSTLEDISAVMAEFSNSITDAVSETGPLLDNQAQALLADAAISSLDQTVETLAALEEEGDVTLPESVTVDELTNLVDSAEEALPEMVNIYTILRANESLVQSTSTALAEAVLDFLPDTGEAIVNLETTDVQATMVQLHIGFAGEAGAVLISLEQDTGNPDRWQFPAGTVLDEDTITAILKGQTYFNVLSENYPDGEIRGQVLPAGINAYIVTPSGMQQMPIPVNSNQFARAAVTLDTNANVAQIHLTAIDTAITAVNLHQGIAGTNGPTVISTEPDQLDGNHWFTSNVELTSEQTAALSAARLYFNIQTAQFPSGELRGQILPPEFDLRLSTIDPAQVVSNAPVTSSASGISAITTNLTASTLTAHTNLYQLTAPALSVRINQGNPGEIGDLLYELSGDPLFEFIPPTEDISHWFVENQVLSADQLVLYLDGGFYVQANTSTYPDGEVRGQLTGGEIDSDGDGVPNSMDQFPQDESESKDTDGDGVGDNSDAFPTDSSESKDTDSDGVGDNADAFPENPAETTDTDGDGTGDNTDQCPTDPSGTVDDDSDGICDSEETPTDQDSDNDGVADVDDAFPNNPNETTDSDGDGVGDNSDAFPLNSSESADSDGDGVGNNADAFPLDASETLDSDGDGVGNNADVFPFDASETADTDGDGIGDNADNCEVTIDPGDADADSDGVVKDCDDVPTFAAVLEIFDANCVSCHGTNGGLTLSSGQAFGELVNVPSEGVPSIDRVEPGDADMSYLVWKLENRAGIVGTVMPQGGALPASEIDAIKSWINGGANP